MSSPSVPAPQPINVDLSRVVGALQQAIPKFQKSSANVGPYYAGLNAGIVNKFGPSYIGAEQGFLRCVRDAESSYRSRIRGACRDVGGAGEHSPSAVRARSRTRPNETRGRRQRQSRGCWRLILRQNADGRESSRRGLRYGTVCTSATQ